MKKVIIRGHVLDYAEKAPFVISGESTLGAMEYDSATDKLRCHECGVWFGGLTQHIWKAHRMPVRDYKIRHGLNLSRSGISTPRRKAIFSATLHKRLRAGSAHLVKRDPLAVAKSVHGPHLERLNVAGRCEAQYIFRIQVLAAQLGHTPTSAELKHSGIHQGSLRKQFGSISKAAELAGLKVRPPGNPTEAPLPTGFPSEHELQESRMPWPKEYFGVRHAERRPMEL